jgi:hypothetical protein
LKPITITFNKGVQFPPKLGTLILKPASDGKAAYAQNIDVSNDEYGNSAIVPGPALTTIGSNSELTGVPFVRQFYGNTISPTGYLYFGQSLLGTKTVIRRVKDILSGSTPTIDTTGSMTIDHSSHANLEIVDMVARPTSGGDFIIYVAIKDDSDTAVYKFNAGDGSPSASLVQANGNFTGGYTRQFLVYSTFDNNIYWIGQSRVSSFDTSDSYTIAKLALGLPLGAYATAGADWQQQLVVAYSNQQFGDFSLRKSGGKAGVALWDYYSPGINRNIPAPCRYISALVNAPDGSLLVFGGVDEGKSSIYTFNGYGFNLVTQYIGDMPHSRHSVDFDAQGRIVWQTADGQFCRFDRASGIFEHLGSITTGSSAGGLLAKGIGSPSGNEFFVASGSGSTYTMKKVQVGSYIGDGGGADTINTPLTASGIQTLPPKSNIQWATLNLTKPLESGERVELRIYKNGSTDYVTYLTMDYSIDGAISSKREDITLDNINSFNAVPVWKQADGLTTAPPVLSVEVMPGITQD